MSRWLGVLFAALSVAFPGFAQGRIVGTVDFRGRALKPLKVRSADATCKAAVIGWEARALVRITRNAPRGTAPSAPVVVEAKGCQYRPWLQGAVRGQKILLRNSDGTTHSVRAVANDLTVFHVIQAPGAKDVAKDPLASDVVRIGCDLHPWMTAFVVVSEHPFFAVTADDGTFEINDVPAGNYGLEAWNDRLGTVRSEVTVEDGKAVESKFTFKLK